jgi:hypothetical protein
MPRWACRILLRVEAVRLERLRAISPADARAEGIERLGENCYWRRYDSAPDDPSPWTDNEITSFATLWDTVRAQRGFRWKRNPWVWVIAFTRVKDGRNDYLVG